MKFTDSIGTMIHEKVDASFTGALIILQSLTGKKPVYIPLTGSWASKFTAVHVVRGCQGGGRCQGGVWVPGRGVGAREGCAREGVDKVAEMADLDGTELQPCWCRGWQ